MYAFLPWTANKRRRRGGLCLVCVLENKSNDGELCPEERREMMGGGGGGYGQSETCING